MSLSELSYYVRKVGPIALVGFFMIMIFYIIIAALLNQTPQTVKKQEAPYSPPFGILEQIHFTHSINYPENVKFTIDNIEGRPITSDTAALVYAVAPSRTKFGYQQNLVFMAKAVGIDTDTQKYQIKGLEARYQDELRTLDVHISTFNFEYELDYKKIPTIFSRSTTPDVTKAKEEAKSFLRKMNTFTPTLAQGTQNVIYLSYDATEDSFNVVATPEEANVIEVDFFPPNLNDHPVVSPTFFNSHIFVTMAFSEEGPIVIKSQVRNFETIEQRKLTSQQPQSQGGDLLPTSGVYPLKSGDEAWQELISGSGIIVSPSKGTTDIIVREMFIGYYALEDFQKYLMPVYVFLGDNGFAAYVSAVKNEYVSKISTQQDIPESFPSPTVPAVIEPTESSETSVPTAPVEEVPTPETEVTGETAP